jgi:hypothetical protein
VPRDALTPLINHPAGHRAKGDCVAGVQPKRPSPVTTTGVSNPTAGPVMTSNDSAAHRPATPYAERWLPLVVMPSLMSTARPMSSAPEGQTTCCDGEPPFAPTWGASVSGGSTWT